MKYCSNCGEEMPPAENWPRQCSSCSRTHFKNPIPVSVVLIPTDRGILTVRRAVGPGVGELALPGGFVDLGETWQEAGVREVFEEIGIEIHADSLVLMGAESTDEGILLLFSRAADIAHPEEFSLDPLEVSEVVTVTEARELAFPTHTRYLAEYFRSILDSSQLS